MRCGLLGETLGHSFSAQLHAALGRYDYEYFEVPPAELGAFLTRGDFDALNVTVPYKQAALPYLAELTPRARRCGAVNVIVRRGGKLIGDNTDYAGLLSQLRRMGVSLRGKRVFIAGAGGAAGCALALARAEGAAEALCVSRSGRGGAPDYETAYGCLADADVLVQATPAGMYPDLSGCALDLDRLPRLAAVADLIYNPLRTRLVLAAQERGVNAAGGLYMLAAQAAESGAVFTGEPFPPGTAERLYGELLRARRNVVLIGMPGSGKSTLGRLLAQRLGRRFLDTDAEVERTADMAIPELFRLRGEAGFRALEKQVVRTLAGDTGLVVACGGGTVLDAENLTALRQNGLLVLLDRPLSELTPSPARPLGDSAEKLRALWEARRALYERAAERRVAVSGTPEETLTTLIREIEA